MAASTLDNSKTFKRYVQPPADSSEGATDVTGLSILRKVGDRCLVQNGCVLKASHAKDALQEFLNWIPQGAARCEHN